MTSAHRRRLVLLFIDGLRADTAAACMGYVGALLQAGRAQATRYPCPLPSLSRPLYATLLTGQSPIEHGIVGNGQVQACGSPWLAALSAAQRCVAMVGYHWFFELLDGRRFDPWEHRDAVPASGLLQAARWYWEDGYPDAHCLADAESLRRQIAADVLLVHPMGMDDAGHRWGGESVEYRLAAHRLDHLLAQLVPLWHGAGYDVLLTSDHGMGADRLHGGQSAAECEVPFVWMPAPGLPVPSLTLPESSMAVADWVERLVLHA